MPPACCLTSSYRNTTTQQKIVVRDPKSPSTWQRPNGALSSRLANLAVNEPAGQALHPTQSEIEQMPIAMAVRLLHEAGNREHPQICGAVCDRCFSGQTDDERQEAADAGALQALVLCMEQHSASKYVQDKSIMAFGNICCGTNERGLARKQLAADAGVLRAVVMAMRSHVTSSTIQENGSGTVGNVTSHVDDTGLARKKLAIDAGAFDAIVKGMRAHLTSPTVTQDGGHSEPRRGRCSVLTSLSTLGVRLRRCRPSAALPSPISHARAVTWRARRSVSSCLYAHCRAAAARAASAAHPLHATSRWPAGADVGGADRKAAAVEADAIETVVEAMLAHEADSMVLEHGIRALANITYRAEPLRKHAVISGARPEWLDGAMTAR